MQLPCFLAISLRVIQLLGCLVPIWWNIGVEAKRHGGLWNYIWYDANDFECRTSHIMPLLLVIYSMLSTIFAIVSLIWESRLYRATNQDCPTKTQPRSGQVESLLEFKLIPLGIILFLIVILGIVTVCFAKSYYDCTQPTQATSVEFTQDDDFWRIVTATRLNEDNPQTSALLWWITYAILWMTQFLESVFVNMTWIALLKRSPASSPAPDLHHDLVEELWNERCVRFCECLGKSTCFFLVGGTWPWAIMATSREPLPTI